MSNKFRGQTLNDEEQLLEYIKNDEIKAINSLALATAITSWVNAFLLFIILTKSKNLLIDQELKKQIKKLFLVCIIFTSLIFYLKDILNVTTDFKLISLFLFVVFGVLLFSILCLLFKVINISNNGLLKSK